MFEASFVFPYSLVIFLVHVLIISHLKYCVILLISLPSVLCPLKLTATLFIVIVLKIFKCFNDFPLLIGKCVNFSAWVIRSFFVILIFFLIFPCLFFAMLSIVTCFSCCLYQCWQILGSACVPSVKHLCEDKGERETVIFLRILCTVKKRQTQKQMLLIW